MYQWLRTRAATSAATGDLSVMSTTDASRFRPWRLLPLVGLFACPVPHAHAQTTQPSDGMSEFDACGVLVRDGNCVLFDGGGGRFALSNYGGYREGDQVRVVGTLDTNCITICAEADGCIRGAVVYNPDVFPCGTPIEVPFDPCAGLSTALVPTALLGLWGWRAAAHPRPVRTPSRILRQVPN